MTRRSIMSTDGNPSFLTLRGGSSDEPSEATLSAPPQTEATSVVEPSQASSAPATGTSSLQHDVESVVDQVTPTSTVTTQLLGPKAPEPGLVRRSLPHFPWHRLPNMLTYLRCFAIPLLAWVFYLPGRHVETSLVFALASLTDFLDGYLARRWDISSSFGAFLDPVADKLMVSTALVLLSGRYGAKVALPAALILGREIAVSALREWMAQRGQRDTVQVGIQGKIKTALTMVALTVYLLVPVDGSGKLGRLIDPAQVLLYMSAAITASSGFVYFRAAAPALRN